jgi:hypothetical protein
VLDDIGHVGLLAGNAGALERFVEDPPGRSDEWLSLAILAIAWLFADQHQLRRPAPFAEHGLGGGLPERACAAAGGRLAQAREGRPLWNQRRGCLGAAIGHSSTPIPGGRAVRRAV